MAQVSSRTLKMLKRVEQRVYFFTGASGAGKTALMAALANDPQFESALFLHFDDIGVPSEEQMIKDYGTASNWQREMTFLWLGKILKEYSDKPLIFFEGQVNIDYIEQGFAKYDFYNYRILLCHCAAHIRHKRLALKRVQPQLIKPNMDNWANYLFKQVTEKKVKILDTGLNSRGMQKIIAVMKPRSG
jgi:hypothetical protein